MVVLQRRMSDEHPNPPAVPRPSPQALATPPSSTPPIRSISPLPSKASFQSHIPHLRNLANPVSTGVDTVDPAHAADRYLPVKGDLPVSLRRMPKTGLPSRSCPGCHIPTLLGTRAFFATIESSHGRGLTTLLHKFGVADDEDLRLLLNMHSSRNARLTGMFDENGISRRDQKSFWARLQDIRDLTRPLASTCLTPCCIKLSERNDLGVDPRFYFLMKKLDLEEGGVLQDVLQDGYPDIATPFEKVVLNYLLRMRDLGYAYAS
ncbi:hypothetical protein B0H11DRAFT_2034696 [Mycena galericulata]|nr:hypothetical protein B0H11DRAFT_2034696 [Mycena galericulata]